MHRADERDDHVAREQFGERIQQTLPMLLVVAIRSRC